MIDDLLATDDNEDNDDTVYEGCSVVYITIDQFLTHPCTATCIIFVKYWSKHKYRRNYKIVWLKHMQW
jgi:hypothetical protein